jgi:hypothetical protein
MANDLLPRLQADPQLGQFWAHRGDDGVKREKQLLIDFLCASAGGPTYYGGRDMALAHEHASTATADRRSASDERGQSRIPAGGLYRDRRLPRYGLARLAPLVHVEHLITTVTRRKTRADERDDVMPTHDVLLQRRACGRPDSTAATEGRGAAASPSITPSLLR